MDTIISESIPDLEPDRIIAIIIKIEIITPVNKSIGFFVLKKEKQ